MITQMDFQTNGYIVSSQVGNPVEQTYGAGSKHHRVRKNNYFGHTTRAANYAGLMEIRIIAGTDTVYLPYYQDQVASVHPPSAGPSFFVTDNMSGCALYIAKRTDGELVVFHANSQTGSNQAAMAIRPPSYQSPAALGELDTLVRNAVPHHGGTIQVVAVLTKLTYLANVDALAPTGSSFLGGTTIAGWRNGTQWEFWFQNWGSISGGGSRLLRAKKFYG